MAIGMEPVFRRISGGTCHPLAGPLSYPMVIRTRLCGFLRRFELTAARSEAANGPERLAGGSRRGANGSWPVGHRFALSAAVLVPSCGFRLQAEEQAATSRHVPSEDETSDRKMNR
jgi:hypothetical protein